MLEPHPSFRRHGVDPVPDFGLIHVEDDLMDPTLLEQAYGECKDLCLPPDVMWVYARDVRRHAGGDRLPVATLAKVLPECTARLLLDYLARVLVRVEARDELALDDEAGFEVGLGQGRSATAELDPFLHLDADEGLRSLRGIARHCLWSSILYLGRSPKLRGGETAVSNAKHVDPSILARSWRRVSLAELAAMDADWVTVEARPNRMLLFRGTQPHFAAPIDDIGECGVPRVILLANLWPAPPLILQGTRGFFRFPDDFMRAFVQLSIDEHAAVYRACRKLSDGDLVALAREYRTFDEKDSLARRLTTPCAECVILGHDETDTLVSTPACERAAQGG